MIPTTTTTMIEMKNPTTSWFSKNQIPKSAIYGGEKETTNT